MFILQHNTNRYSKNKTVLEFRTVTTSRSSLRKRNISTLDQFTPPYILHLLSLKIFFLLLLIIYISTHSLILMGPQQTVTRTKILKVCRNMMRCKSPLSNCYHQTRNGPLSGRAKKRGSRERFMVLARAEYAGNVTNLNINVYYFQVFG